MSTPKDYPVLVHFRRKDPKTGTSVWYDPDGPEGWPGAKDTFTGVPGSDEVKDLQAGAGGIHGPLIGEPLDAKKTTTSDKEN